MSRTVPRASGPNWLAAVAGAMALAAALAVFTTPRNASPNPSPALPPAAHATVTAPTSAAPAAAAKAQATTVKPATYNMEAGQRIAIDPATGQARPIEHDDVQAPSSARVAAVDVQEVTHPSGAVGVMIPDSSDVYLVATKSAKGTVSIAHANGRDAAAQKMREAVSTAHRPNAQEDRNDR
jgi:hypothetical protein